MANGQQAVFSVPQQPTIPGFGGGADAAVSQQALMVKRLSQINNQFQKKVPPMEKLFKKLGLDVSMKGLLKQSQIFTGTLGAIFQILGAFIDITLAPMIPLIVPAIRKMVKAIPKFRELGEKIKDTIIGFSNFMDKLIPKFIKKMGGSPWIKIIIGYLLIIAIKSLIGGGLRAGGRGMKWAGKKGVSAATGGRIFGQSAKNTEKLTKIAKNTDASSNILKTISGIRWRKGFAAMFLGGAGLMSSAFGGGGATVFGSGGAEVPKSIPIESPKAKGSDFWPSWKAWKAWNPWNPWKAFPDLPKFPIDTFSKLALPPFLDDIFSKKPLPTYVDDIFTTKALPTYADDIFEVKKLPTYADDIFTTKALPGYADDIFEVKKLPTYPDEVFSNKGLPKFLDDIFTKLGLPKFPIDTFSKLGLPKFLDDIFSKRPLPAVPDDYFTKLKVPDIVVKLSPEVKGFMESLGIEVPKIASPSGGVKSTGINYFDEFLELGGSYPTYNADVLNPGGNKALPPPPPSTPNLKVVGLTADGHPIIELPKTSYKFTSEPFEYKAKGIHGAVSWLSDMTPDFLKGLGGPLVKFLKVLQFADVPLDAWGSYVQLQKDMQQMEWATGIRPTKMQEMHAWGLIAKEAFKDLAIATAATVGATGAGLATGTVVGAIPAWAAWAAGFAAMQTFDDVSQVNMNKKMRTVLAQELEDPVSGMKFRVSPSTPLGGQTFLELAHILKYIDPTGKIGEFSDSEFMKGKNLPTLEAYDENTGKWVTLTSATNFNSDQLSALDRTLGVLIQVLTLPPPTRQEQWFSDQFGDRLPPSEIDALWKFMTSD